MYWPHQILVLGDRAEAKAVSQLLEFTGASCKNYPVDKVTQQHGQVSDAQLLDHLRESKLVIMLSSVGMPLQRFTHVIYRLRSDDALNWEGVFVAVVEQTSHKMQLVNLDLLGDARERFRFGDCPGHYAISRPLRIADLLDTISEAVELSAYGWASLLEQASVGQILARLKKAESVCASTDLEQALSALQSIYERMNEVRWFDLLIDKHRFAGFMQELVEAQNLENLRSAEDCYLALENIRGLLSQTSIGGDARWKSQRKEC